MSLKPYPLFLAKLLHWEFWNSKLVYFPLYPLWLWLSLKARSFMFLTAANPRITNGGYIMERKRDIYDQLPAHLYPTTLYFEPGTPLSDILAAMQTAGLSFPIIAKPDIGERGMAVKKIKEPGELEAYAQLIPVTFLVQRLIEYPLELGVFYWRMPGTTTGHISGLVNKEAAIITGDGVHTIAAIVAAHPRYCIYASQLAQLNEQIWATIPAKGELVNLMPYGNHCRGSKFTDVTHRLTPGLNATLLRVMEEIPEFYYGRLDIRFASWEALERGEQFAIIEVNGSGSEPTHIYDPSHTLWQAWQIIAQHWRVLCAISMANRRAGVPYLTLAEGQEQVRLFREIEARLAARVW